MRILFVFLLGVLSAFYLTEGCLRGLKKFNLLPKNRYLHHSEAGLIVLLGGVLTFFLAPELIGSANTTLLSTFLLGTGVGMISHHLLSESFFFFPQAERNFLRKHDHLVERFLEIIPGASTWLALASPIWLSFIFPFAVAYIILLADIYWLFSAVRISVLTYLGYKKMEAAKRIDWLERLKKDYPQDWQELYHFFVIPVYKEGLEVVGPCVDAIASANYPKEKIFIGIGYEEKSDPQNIAQMRDYIKKYEGHIGGIFFTVHPSGLPGELRGPATNRNWIINNAVKEFTKRGLKPSQVIATTLDSDFVVHPQFLAGALYKYLSQPKDVRDKRSFTGVFLYHNNYWQCPAFTRLISSGTAFWQLAEMVGSDKYINFSSLSMNLKSLLEIGLWMPDKVNDDSGFFWKAYYHFKGDYKVLPHYLPISADTVLDVTFYQTFKNQYKQLQRWAYGVEHIPFIIRQYFARTDIDFWDKTDKLTFILWSYFKWGTLALFVTFAGVVIPLVNPHYTESVVAYNLPVISSWILTGAFIGLFSTIYIHERTAPPRPKSWSLLQKFWSYIQWTLIPIILVTITSIPAIDAQTRLMLGKYIEFYNTKKARLAS
ncbi:MAG: glycosyltransferase family 2 protein [bacterium]|nr:glycosyltransferase family 2 protein [bacterium]